MLMFLLATVGSELVGYGTLLLGVGSIAAIIWGQAKNRTERAVTRSEMRQALVDQEKSLKDHMTAQRIQTTRYVDRKVETLVKNQNTLLDMVAEVDGKVTKRANSSTRTLVSVGNER